MIGTKEKKSIQGFCSINKVSMNYCFDIPEYLNTPDNVIGAWL